MPRKKNNKSVNNSIANDSERQLAAARDEEEELLHRKHELELEECKIRQQKEELAFRMKRLNPNAANVDSSLGSDSTNVSPNQHNPSTTNAAVAVADASLRDSAIIDVLLKSQEQQSRMIAALQMPKVELQVFDGNPLHYWNFIRLFQSSVECYAEDNGKLTRLMQYTTGKAKSAIQCCSIMTPSDGYHKAMKILKERFGNNDAISQAWVSKVMDGPVLKGNDCIGLRDLADDMQNCYCVLRSIDMLNEVDHQGGLLKIMHRLPGHLQNRWRKAVSDLRKNVDRAPKFADLMKFVLESAEEANDPVYGVNKHTSFNEEVKNSKHAASKSDHNKRPQSTALATHTEQYQNRTADSRVVACFVCNGEHEPSECDKFKKMSLDERYKVVQENRRCRNCFQQGHRAKYCQSHQVCSKCNKWHHVLLHAEGGLRNSAAVAVNSYASFRDTQYATVRLHSVLPIVPVLVKSTDGRRQVKAYALLDSGSTDTFCSLELADELQVGGQFATIQVSTVDQVKRAVKVKRVQLRLADVNGNNEVIVKDVYAKSGMNINAELIASSGELQHWPHLRDVPIHCLSDTKIHLVIGQDLPDLLLPRNVRSGAVGEPFAVETLLGWALNGPLKSSSTNTEVIESYLSVCDEPSLDNMVERFWKLDCASLSEDRMISQTDMKVLELWGGSTERENEHYVLPIPLKNVHAVKWSDCSSEAT